MIAWLIETALAVTFLMLLVLAVRKPVAHLFGAGWAYALWALPALRLVLPPLHLLGDTFPTLFPAQAAAPLGYAVAPAAAAAGSAVNWEALLLAAWLGGAALIVLWQSWRYLAFIRRLGIGSHIHASLAQEIGIIESPEVEGPLAIGLLDRWIVVPADFATRYTPREQRLALQHERTHHAREDIFWNMVALGVLALNWFNPVAYLAFRAFRADQELSCDAAVAARASNGERHEYAMALVKSASRPGLIAACPLNHAGQLKRRLKMMKAHRCSRLRALGGSGALGALLLTGISVTESASIAAPETAAALAAPSLPAAVMPAPQPAAARAAPLRAQQVPLLKPARTAVMPKVAPPAVTKLASRVVAAPEPVAAAPESPSTAPAPAPSAAQSRVFMVRLDGPSRLTGHHAVPVHELKLARTHIRTVRLDPGVRAQLERILAARTQHANQIQFITVKDQ